MNYIKSLTLKIKDDQYRIKIPLVITLLLPLKWKSSIKINKSEKQKRIIFKDLFKSNNNVNVNLAVITII